MKIAVQESHLVGQILYRSLDRIKKTAPKKTIYSEKKKRKYNYGKSGKRSTVLLRFVLGQEFYLDYDFLALGYKKYWPYEGFSGLGI